MSKIYTRTGDDGSTGLACGQRLSKGHALIEAYGTVDELNSVLGQTIYLLTQDKDIEASDKQEELLSEWRHLQNRLFDVGSRLACQKEEFLERMPKITETDIELLEKSIDKMTQELPELKNFILPGGSATAASTHLARTTCRRAERWLIRAAEDNAIQVDEASQKFLNRLSDYFFTAARYCNHLAGHDEVTWTAQN